MLNNVFKVYRTYLKLNYVFLLAYTAGLIGVCLLYDYLDRSWALRAEGTFENSYQFLTIFVMMAACFGSLPIYLGFQFNTHKTNSWLRTLPVKHWLLMSIPYVLMIFYGIFVYVLFLEQFLTAHIRFGAPSTQYLFVLPLCAFQCIKSTKNPWVGLGVAAVATFILLYITMDFLWEYNRYFWQFYIELIFISLFALVGISLERENRLVPFVVAASLVFVTSIPISYPYLRTPSTFENTVSDLNFFHSERAISNYRTFLTTASNWVEIKDRDINAASYYSWRNGQKYLNAEDQIALFDILVKNYKKLPYNYGIVNRGPYLPVSYWAFGDEAVERMIATWEATPAYCLLLPPDPNKLNVLELAVSKQGCKGQLLERILERNPGLLLSDKLRSKFFQILKTAYSRADTQHRVTLQNFIINTGRWQSKPEFDGSRLSDELLGQWASLFRQNERDKIRGVISEDYQEFRRNFMKLVKEDKDIGNREILYFVCRLASANCSGMFELETARNPINLLRRNSWARSLGKRRTNNYMTYVLMTEISKRKSWEALRKSNI